MTFSEALSEQRWDDHRYYHHSRVNQSLHLVSALCFIASYALLFVEPALATLLAWLVAMPSRQIGHFWFEPKGYDHENQATHEFKEQVKVGYNLRRKVVLLSIWIASPALLLIDPALFGAVTPGRGWFGILHNVSLIWLVVGVGAVVGRTVQLFFIRGVQAGLVWFTKILTDPLHDVALYYKAPMRLWQGELYDPIIRHDAAVAMRPSVPLETRGA
jgi:hypothetical protein